MCSMQVAVLGPIPRDNITTYRGQTVEKYGCAVYTAAAIASIAGPEAIVYTVSNIRKIDMANVTDLLSAFPNMDLSYIRCDADQGDVINLTYIDQKRREEQQTGFMNPILPRHIDGLLSCDAFVFVPITDFEVPLETLKFIKNNSDALIVFDAHGPTNCCNSRGERHHKFWIDRDRWLSYIDLLKMNLEEARCGWFEGDYQIDDQEDSGELSIEELPKFAQHCLDRGVKALYITLDEEGCAVYFKAANGKMIEHIVPRILVDNVVDTTGCGDSFAGGLAFGYLRTEDYIKAAQYGNYAGAMRCTSIDLDVYGSLAETDRQIRATYGDITNTQRK
jgi:adenosine kinase